MVCIEAWSDLMMRTWRGRQEDVFQAELHLRVQA